MSADRHTTLARIAAAHDAWVDRHLESAPFNPESRPDSEDYNVWYLDMADDTVIQGEFMATVTEIMADSAESEQF
jgi:hypothetical protein